MRAMARPIVKYKGEKDRKKGAGRGGSGWRQKERKKWQNQQINVIKKTSNTYIARQSFVTNIETKEKRWNL